jgi:hypothetical protein
MTFRTESRLTIAGSVGEVWAYLAEVGNWPQWAPTVLEGRVRGGGPLRAGARVDQRARLVLGLSRRRSQRVTLAEAPTAMAFAGPMGPSTARWGMELAPAAGGGTDAVMWVEVDLPALLRGRVQRVSDLEMTLIKAAVEAAARHGAVS